MKTEVIKAFEKVLSKVDKQISWKHKYNTYVDSTQSIDIKDFI